MRSRTYLIGVVNIKEGRQVRRKDHLKDIVTRRRLVLRGKIGERAAEQRHMRYMRLAALRSREDIAQSLTLAPRCDFFPWSKVGKIGVRDLLRFL